MNLSTWSNTIKTLKGVCSGIVFLAKHFQLKLQYKGTSHLFKQPYEH